MIYHTLCSLIRSIIGDLVCMRFNFHLCIAVYIHVKLFIAIYIMVHVHCIWVIQYNNWRLLVIYRVL